MSALDDLLVVLGLLVCCLGALLWLLGAGLVPCVAAMGWGGLTAVVGGIGGGR